MKKTTLLTLVLIALFSCKKDDNFSDIPTDNPTQTVTDTEFAQNNFGQVITTNFVGQIFDTSGETISGVQITVGNQGVLTDHNGVFVLNNALAYEKFAYVTATKSGYINGSKTILPTPNGVNDIQITLLKKEIIGSVSTGNSSEIELPNGSKVAFQGEFIDASGNPYNGQVDVSMHYLEPNIESTFSEMPGMLFGMREDGSSSGMETYGMLAVNLFSTNGEQLNIAETSPATLSFPVASSTPNAPNEIPLWYFDEVTGYWKEQGIATKIGNEYIAEVTHFSWWNCDLSVQVINVCFELNITNTLPNQYFEIIRNQSGQLMFSGYTNDVGEECILFPVNEEVTINVYGNSCTDSIIYTETLGPFSSDTSITITVDTLPTELVETIITGDVTSCDGTSMENGYIFLFNPNSLNFSDYTIIPITNGSVNYDFIYCSSDNYNMIVYDLTINQSSEVIEVALIPGETDINVVSACGNQNGGVYFGDLILDDQGEIDVFGLFGYTSIEGTLTIQDLNSNNEPDDVISLAPLESLTSVLGDLKLVANPLLTNLSGLNNLTTVGGLLEIKFMEIETLSDLANLNYIDGLTISANPNLSSLNGLENISTIGAEGVLIRENNTLTSLSGLDNLEVIGANLHLYLNNLLTNLSGLDNLTTISGDFIINATNLISINSLTNLSVIGGQLSISSNTDLTSLNGLENINSLNSFLFISYNDSLTSLSGLDGLTIVGDTFWINDNPTLQSLNGLNSLTTTQGQFRISENPVLTSLDGLNNLTLTEDLVITGNPGLTTLNGLNNLNSSTSVTIGGNSSLSSLNGLESLTSSENFIVNFNAQLTSISSLNNLTDTDYLYIENNVSLTSLNGLENINSVIDLIIWGNSSIVNLSGLDGLSSVNDTARIINNSSLTALSGLENLLSINELNIGTNISNENLANANLSDFCALTNLFTNGTSTTNNIAYNAYNPSEQDIIDGDCSQ